MVRRGPDRGPVLGIKQPFPQKCFDCSGLFMTGDPVHMLPVISEGDILSVGRWPALSGNYGLDNYGGRVLWARWLCSDCASFRPGVVSEEVEPVEIRRARLAAEHGMNRAAVAKGRQAAVERARSQIYEATD